MQSVEALANGQANKTHRPEDASTQKLLNIINGQSLPPSQAKPNKWEKKSVQLISHGEKKGKTIQEAQLFIYETCLGNIWIPEIKQVQLKHLHNVVLCSRDLSQVSHGLGLKSLPVCWRISGVIYDSELLLSKVFSSPLESQCHAHN